MNWKRLLIGLFIGVILLGAGYWGYRRLAATPAVDALRVTATAVSPPTSLSNTNLTTVSAQGQVVPLSQTTLAFQLGGQVVEILASEGQTVQPGDPLVRLDAREPEIRAHEAETAVLQAQANLALAQAGLSQSQVELDLANLDVQAATAQLSLLQAGATTAQIAVIENQVEVATAEVQLAAANQSVVLAGASAAEIEVAQAQLVAAQAQLFAVRVTTDAVLNSEYSNVTEREVAQLRLNAALASVNAAQTALDELLAGATDAAQMAASGGVAAATAQQSAAQSQLALALAGTRAEQIAVATANVDQATEYVTEAEIRLQQAETAVSQAEALLTEAQVGLQVAQNNLDKATLTAPFAGTIADLTVEVGQVILPGDTVATLADFSDWHVETIDLTEFDVVAIALGDSVDVVLDAFPRHHLPGHIVAIARTSQDTRAKTTYTVTVLLDKTDLPLRWGMTALVTVEVGN